MYLGTEFDKAASDENPVLKFLSGQESRKLFPLNIHQSQK